MAAGTPTYRLGSLVVLPFRAEIEEGSSETSYPGDDGPTLYRLIYRPELDLGMGHRVPTAHCTFLHIDYPKKHSAPADAFRQWAHDHGTRLFCDDVLPRVNHFLACLEAATTGPYQTIPYRPVGEVDSLFHNLEFEGVAVYSRASSTLFASLPVTEARVPLPPKLPNKLPPEWLLLSRAVHLVNHGFYGEAVLVGFSLLDDQVQKFLASQFPNIERGEGELLVRAIETDRMKRYFGFVMRLCVGSSPIDDPGMARELTWLNRHRNEVVHRATPSSMGEAQRALRTVKRLLDFLGDHGAGMTLPEVLRFWTPEVPHPESVFNEAVEPEPRQATSGISRTSSAASPSFASVPRHDE